MKNIFKILVLAAIVVIGTFFIQAFTVGFYSMITWCLVYFISLFTPALNLWIASISLTTWSFSLLMGVVITFIKWIFADKDEDDDIDEYKNEVDKLLERFKNF